MERKSNILAISILFSTCLAITLAFNIYDNSKKKEEEIYYLLSAVQLVINNIETDLEKQYAILNSTDFETETQNYKGSVPAILDLSNAAAYMFKTVDDVEDAEDSFIELNKDLHVHYQYFTNANDIEEAKRENENITITLEKIKELRDYLDSINKIDEPY
ncbi:hypothetical protein [Jeotgalibacillus malaysiensis]|uniref:hypothetical protein n=1 Tax=Jeotgalibacillus malaysiensis TaxID=1508404 RepID=UPI0038516970